MIAVSDSDCEEGRDKEGLRLFQKLTWRVFRSPTLWPPSIVGRAHLPARFAHSHHFLFLHHRITKVNDRWHSMASICIAGKRCERSHCSALVVRGSP